jgi:hypothetical protein
MHPRAQFVKVAFRDKLAFESVCKRAADFLRLRFLKSGMIMQIAREFQCVESGHEQISLTTCRLCPRPRTAGAPGLPAKISLSSALGRLSR